MATADDLRDAVIGALRKVFDPEIPLNVYDLGLIYDISVSPDASVAVRMTLTAPNCPAAGVLPADVERAARSVAGIRDVRVELTFDPPWSRERVPEAARLALGIEDLIPPKRKLMQLL